MSLEAVVIILDNSQYSINGDYAPTRFAAQADAVHVIFANKTRQNPENEVGLMVMAGKAPEVLVTPTQDEGKLVTALHSVIQGGQSDLVTGVQVAQLALKHRQNKNQRQRIIAFVGSPVSTDAQSLVKLGKKMKKNNVAIDIISFGTEDGQPTPAAAASSSSSAAAVMADGPASESNEAKLSAFVDAVNSSDNSHFLKVEPGPYLLSDRVNASPILRGEGASGSGGGGGGDGMMQDDDGVDPNLDPELAMALRMSLEEERARQAAASGASSTAPAASSQLTSVAEESSAAPAAASGATGASAVASSATDVGMTDSTSSTTAPPIDASAESASGGLMAASSGGASSEEQEQHDDLARALAMSQQAGAQQGDVEMADEDEDMARAIAMSMQEQQEEEEKKK